MAVLVTVSPSEADFSVTEKDEASLPNCFREEFVECLHSPFWRGLKVFVFQTSLWSLNPETRPANAGLN